MNRADDKTSIGTARISVMARFGALAVCVLFLSCVAGCSAVQGAWRAIRGEQSGEVAAGLAHAGGTEKNMAGSTGSVDEAEGLTAEAFDFDACVELVSEAACAGKTQTKALYLNVGGLDEQIYAALDYALSNLYVCSDILNISWQWLGGENQSTRLCTFKLEYEGVGILPTQDVPMLSEAAFRTWISSAVAKAERNPQVLFQNPGISSAAFEALRAQTVKKHAEINYMASEYHWQYRVYDDYVFISLSIAYIPDKLPVQALYQAWEREDTLQYLMSSMKNGYETVTIYVKDADITTDELDRLLVTCMYNCTESFVLLGENTKYSFYMNADGTYIAEMSVNHYGVSEEEYNALAEKTKQELDIFIEELDTEGKSDEELYRLIYKKLCKRISYDTGLRSDILNETQTDGLKYSRGLYGAMVQRSTICSGYAAAYKAVCDRLGLECWVISGTADGNQHAWNAVILNGEVMYVDATYGDTAGTDSYCLLSQRRYEKEDRQREDKCYVPQRYIQSGYVD